MHRLTIYFTPHYASVTVQNGVNREVTAPMMPAVISAMHPDDRAVLQAFCTAVLATIAGNDQAFRSAELGTITR